ncbi:MAG: ATP-binding protein [Bacteroidetes bacterium]|nr:ATP-binding protein [Bacteroidota bacterium]
MNDTYDETIKSRFDDIIKDGPGINTGILEKTDNMIEWGDADHITIKYVKNCPKISRPYIELSDNSKTGFGDPESIERFFRLGKTNKKATGTTIGKYGKGGYKAVISMSDMFKLTTHIGNKTYKCGTNFRTMEKDNTWEPTEPLKIYDNPTGLSGSSFKIYLPFSVKNTRILDFDDLRRHIIRGYHDTPKTVRFTLISDTKEDTFTPSEYSPYGEYISKKTVYIHKGNGDELFVVSDQKEKSFATINSYILKKRITINPYLGLEGVKVPGIDFYRNGRMCNTRYPISKIGKVGSLIQKGQMRGKRCHITVHFTDKKVDEERTFDDCIGVTTVKDIYEDDRMDNSLIKILERTAEECADDYEDYIKKQKDGITGYMDTIQKHTNTLNSDDKFIDDKFLDKYQKEMDNFTEFKIEYYDETDDQIKFASNKEEVKEQKAEGNKPHRGNSQIINRANSILQVIKRKQVTKKDVIAKKERIVKIMVEKDLDEKSARLIYNQEKENEKSKKQMDSENKLLALKKEQERLIREKEKDKKQHEEEQAIRVAEKEAENAKKEAEKRKKQEEIELEKKKEKAIEKANIEKKINKLKEDVVKMSIEDLQKFWVEQQKNIMMGNE